MESAKTPVLAAVCESCRSAEVVTGGMPPDCSCHMCGGASLRLATLTYDAATAAREPWMAGFARLLSANDASMR